MSDIAYQNKDIVSKIFGQGLKEKSLEVYGIKASRVVDVLPVNLPAIEANELSTDNLFRLEDGSLAVIDYESSFSEESKTKYLGHIARVAKLYGANQRIRMIVLYTCSARDVNTSLDMGCLKLNIEAGYLSSINSEEILLHITRKIARQEILSEKEIMQLVILPLTKMDKSDQQALLEEVVNLAKKLSEEQQTFSLAAILTFSDKIIEPEYAKQVKEWIRMTKVGRLFEEEKLEAVRKVEQEKKALNEEKNALYEEKNVLNKEKNALKLLLRGKTMEEVSQETGLSMERLRKLMQ